MPKIVDTYAKNNKIEEENISIQKKDNGNIDCTIDSENNSELKLSNYESEAYEVVESVKEIQEEETNSYEQSNVKQKTLGTYPSKNEGNNSSNKAVFIPMTTLIALMSFGILVIELLMVLR